MEVVQNTPEKLIVRFDANYSLANALRRSIDEIPILAIDEVEIFKNDSPLYDEVLAHRLGLVPLKTEKKMGEKTSIDLKIVKAGQGTVYSGDLKGAAEIVYKNMPITLLEKSQELEVVATAKLGKGIEHAKYSPGIAYYRNVLEIKTKNAEIQKIIENSKNELKAEKKGDSWKCDLNDSEIDEIRKIDDKAINETDELLFFVESFGQIAAKEIMIKAIDSLNDNLAEFEKAVK